jgi:AcrR family transcriptional regulator
MATSTRDRIIEAAMELFGERGYRGTSVAQIERAAGLTPGAGGLYHHFRTKEAVLSAGVERHLARLHALRDIQRVLGGLGEPRAELTVIARYALAEMDQEGELMRIMAAEAVAHPEMVGDAVRQLFGVSYARFGEWLRAAGLTAERAEAVAAVGFGALFSARLFRVLLGADPVAVDDDTYVATWVDMVEAML